MLGFFRIDSKDVEEKCAAVDLALDGANNAFAIAGRATDIAEFKRASVLLARATLTLVEERLLHCKKTVEDVAAMRLLVQEQVRKARARGLKEKEALAPAIYKFAYQALTCQ